MIPDLSSPAFVDAQPRPVVIDATTGGTDRAIRRLATPPFGTGRSNRLIQPLSRFVAWAVGSVVLALALDVMVRNYLPQPDFRLDLLVIAAITLPLLLVGGHLFVRQALQQEKALHWQQARHWLRARRDALVWALNRSGFGEIVQQLNTEAPGQRAALFVLDLHDFQRINDACGHAVGDQVLRETARRLRDVLHRHSVLGRDRQRVDRRAARPHLVRLGSDELACWLPLWPGTDDPAPLAQAMLACLSQPYEMGGDTGGLRLRVKGNVGYLLGTVNDPGLQRGEAWMTRVNAAVQQAKALGAGHCVAFAAEQLAAMVRRHEVHQALERALASGVGLHLHYQPIVSVGDGQLVGCEALIRWQHPQWGPVSPVEFIPVAEGSDLIRPLGRWVLTQGIRQLAQWRSDPHLPGVERMRLSINLSRAQLLDTELVDFVQGELNRHQVPPAALCLEVTESLPLDDATCVQTLQTLHQRGITIALDDFGTGYSSLSALLNLPLHSVKIDRQFISGIDDCVHRQSLVAAVLRVAQGMRLNVVAEGIEKTAEAETLLRLGCHHMQGWLISRALAPEALASQWLQHAPHTVKRVPAAQPLAACADTECGHTRFGRCPAVVAVPAAVAAALPLSSGV